MANIQLNLPPGKYIVAVSGGVDSMVLLHLISKLPGVELVVAHANHGQRPDASQDQALVKSFAMSHNLKFESSLLDLQPKASEDRARKARYEFLQKCRKKYKALAIITAHHRDDMLETAIINILRGTAWRGLAPFAPTNNIVRPLLDYPKSDILNYARQNKIAWREDSTNADQTYLRNYVRQSLMPLFSKRSSQWQIDFLRYIRNQQALRRKINQNHSMIMKEASTAKIQKQKLILRRYFFIMSPKTVAYDHLQFLCAQYLGGTLQRHQALALLHFIKSARPNKEWRLANRLKSRALVSQIIVDSPLLVVS